MNLDFPYIILSHCTYNDFIYLCVTEDPVRSSGTDALNFGIIRLDAEMNYTVIRRFDQLTPGYEHYPEHVRIPYLSQYDGTPLTGREDFVDVNIRDFTFCVGENEIVFARAFNVDGEATFCVLKRDGLVVIDSEKDEGNMQMMQYVGGLIYYLFPGEDVTYVGVFGSVGGRNVLDFIPTNVESVSNMMVDEDHRIYVADEESGYTGSFTAEEPNVVWDDTLTDVGYFMLSRGTILYTGGEEPPEAMANILVLPSGTTKAAR